MLRRGIVIGFVFLASCTDGLPDDGTPAGLSSSKTADSRYACGCVVARGMITADLRCGEALCFFDAVYTCADNAKVVTTGGDTCAVPDAGASIDAGTSTDRDAGASTDAGRR